MGVFRGVKELMDDAKISKPIINKPIDDIIKDSLTKAWLMGYSRSDKFHAKIHIAWSVLVLGLLVVFAYAK